MLSKIMLVATLATFVGATAALAQPQGSFGGSNGSSAYADQYGLGYTNTARHDPRDTNGF